MTDAAKRTCFVICPIGPVESDIRKRTEQVLKYLIEPAATECGYDEVLAAHKLPEPGVITRQVIEHLLKDPMVVADLSGRNANVFYELAFRHTVGGPIVHIVDNTEEIPFDVAGTRAIVFNLHDLDSVARAKMEIVDQMRSGQAAPQRGDNPISMTVTLDELRKSESTTQQALAKVLAVIEDLRVEVAQVRAGQIAMERDQRNPFRPHSAINRMLTKHSNAELLKAFDVILQARLSPGEAQPPPSDTTSSPSS